MKNLTLQDLTFGPQDDNRGVIDFKSPSKNPLKKWFFAMEQSKFLNIVNNSAVTVRAPEMRTFAIINSNFSNLRSNQGPAINPFPGTLRKNTMKINDFYFLGS